MEAVKKYDLILTEEDSNLLKDLVEIMEIFEIFNVHIQGQTYPTLNSIVLFRSEIISKYEMNMKQNRLLPKLIIIITPYIYSLKRIQERRDVDEWIHKAATLILSRIDIRFPLNEQMIASAILDPRI